MDLIQIADSKLAEMKARKAELIEEERVLRAQRDLLVGATKEKDWQPARETPAAPTDEKPKRGRKAGEKPRTERIFDALVSAAPRGLSVAQIADAIGAEKRGVSYTLQQLAKQGKVQLDGALWFADGAHYAPARELTPGADAERAEDPLEQDEAA